MEQKEKGIEVIPFIFGLDHGAVMQMEFTRVMINVSVGSTGYHTIVAFEKHFPGGIYEATDLTDRIMYAVDHKRYYGGEHREYKELVLHKNQLAC